MLVLALTVTSMIGMLVVIVAAGLIAQKMTFRLRTVRNTRLEELYQQKLDPILLEDLPSGSHDPDSLAYRQSVKQRCEPLRLELANVSSFSRQAHRAALRRVMLNMSRELVGETLARLTLAFQVFGFVDEELRDLARTRWWIRARACRDLALMKAGDATADLVILLQDDEEDVRTEAAMALVSIAGVKALSPLLTNLHTISVWMSIQLSKAVLSMASAAVPDLIAGLQSDYPSVKSFCIDMLGEIGDIAACAPLIEFAKTARGEQLCKCLLAIGNLGDETGREVLLEHLSNTDEVVRVCAAQGLGHLGSK
ncbi:MAG TPA: HEAT repeat domain-containing protein, partial [Bacteroidota bacterium]